MYRDDYAATHAKLETIQRDLDQAQSQGVQDQQRIAMLTAQLAATQEALQRIGGQMNNMQGGFGGYAGYQLPERGSTVLVLGILSLVVCTALGPFAWSMGTEELRRIDAGLTPATGRGAAVAGRVCGIISSCFLGLALLFVMFMMIVGVAASH
jgi:hypothetical protein